MATLDDLSLEQLQALYAQKTDPNVAAIHSIESGGAAATANPVNPASGASGSMQTMKRTSEKPGFGVAPSDGTPIDKTRLGVQYYQKMVDRYGDPVKAAVAYDWGPGNADKWIANGAKLDDLPLETLQYVQKFQQKTGANAPAAAQTAPPAPPQPSKLEMNIVQEPAADTPEYTRMGRVEQGVMSTLGGAARAGLHGLGWLLGKAGDTQGAQSINDTVQQAEEAQAARDREFALKTRLAGGDPSKTDWYQIGGKMIPGFLVPGGNAQSLLGAAAQGAAGGAVLGAADTPPGESYGQHAAGGALMGGAGGAAVAAIGKLIRGAQLSPQAQLLKDEGVTMTPGMVGGKIANDIEQKATSWPIVGPLIGDARRNAMHDMNTAAINRALDPIGESIPSNLPIREALAETKSKLSDAYKEVLPNLSFAPDAQFTQDMQQVLTKQADLPDNMRPLFDNFMENYFKKQTVPGPNGTQVLTGDKLKQAESALAANAKNFMSSGDAFQRNLGGIYRDTLTAMRQALLRQNPQYAPRLEAINNGFSIYALLREAGKKVTNPENPIMAGQLQQAVRANAGGVNGEQFALGTAKLQDLSDAASKVLGANVPDSGTVGRLMMGAGILGGTGIPMLAANPGLAAGVAAGAAGYGTKVGQQAMFALLARRPELAKVLGDIIVQNAGKVGGVGGGVLSGQMGQ